MKAVSLRISGGSRAQQMSDPLLLFDTSHVQVADPARLPSAQMFSLRAANWPDAMYPLHDVDAVLLIGRMPDTSSEQTASYWQTSPLFVGRVVARRKFVAQTAGQMRGTARSAGTNWLLPVPRG